MKLKPLLICIFSILFLFACKTNHNDLDLSNEHIHFQLQRFGQDLFALSGKDSIKTTDLKALQKKYGNFFDLYVQGIIRVGKPDAPALGYYLSNFINDKDIQKVYHQTMKKYDDIDDIESNLKQAFKYYHHYFPKQNIPNIYTFVSGFNYATVVDSNILGIGLDMYLGKDYSVYKMLDKPEYIRRNMDKQYIVANAVKGWLVSTFPKPDSIKDVLGNMIYYGKIYYILDHLMPDAPDSIKIGYTQAQLDWCEANQKEMWKHLINMQLLYSKKDDDVKKFIGEGPFTPGFPKGSPGRVGQWIGWQIVKKYMQEKPKTAINRLFSIPNNQTFLIKSKYKPK